MAAVEKYHKYSKAADREAEKKFAAQKEVVEEAIRIEKSKILVLTKRMHKIKDVESIEFSETVRMIRKSEKRIEEFSRELADILKQENRVYNELLDKLLSEDKGDQ